MKNVNLKIVNSAYDLRISEIKSYFKILMGKRYSFALFKILGLQLNLKALFRLGVKVSEGRFHKLVHGTSFDYNMLIHSYQLY